MDKKTIYLIQDLLCTIDNLYIKIDTKDIADIKDSDIMKLNEEHNQESIKNAENWLEKYNPPLTFIVDNT